MTPRNLLVAFRYLTHSYGRFKRGAFSSKFGAFPNNVPRNWSDRSTCVGPNFFPNSKFSNFESCYGGPEMAALCFSGSKKWKFGSTSAASKTTLCYETSRKQLVLPERLPDPIKQLSVSTRVVEITYIILEKTRV